MKNTLTLFPALLLSPLPAPFGALCAADVRQSNAGDWIQMGRDGKLEYQTTAKGDRIADFSHAGCGGGGVKLPAPTVKTQVTPSGGDDSAAIQLKQASSSSGPWLSSPQAPVNPLSLYLAQLRERLGESALKNIGYYSPLCGKQDNKRMNTL